MNKTLIVATITLFIKVACQAQFVNNNEIGHYIDINGQIIDGYFGFDYEPEEFAKFSHTVGKTYTPGYYYNLKGKKIDGIIKMSTSDAKHFFFRTSLKGFSKSIRTVDCLAFVIGTDSFTILNNVENQSHLGIRGDGKFAEVLESFDDLSFYKYRIQCLNNSAIKYLVKADTSNKMYQFPEKKDKFIKMATSFFGDYELLRKKIESGEYTLHNLPTMIKLLKYKRLCDSNKNIYFNNSWDEVEQDEEYTYFAIPEIIGDSLFHLKYLSKDSTLLCEGNFSSFYPHIKEEEFIWYYPNGKIRRVVNYKNNMPTKLSSYYNNGELLSECRQLTNGEIYYNSVYDEFRNNILDENGNGINYYLDPIRDIKLVMEYQEHKLGSVFYVNSEDVKIYQYDRNERTANIIKQIRFNIRNNIDYPDKSIAEGNHGFVLIKCICESGKAKNFEVLKGIDEECDSLALNFISDDELSHIWKRVTKKKDIMAREIVIPFEFAINRYSGYRNNYNNFWRYNYFYFPKIPSLPKLPKVSFPMSTGF